MVVFANVTYNVKTLFDEKKNVFTLKEEFSV